MEKNERDRITCITLLDKESLNKINSVIKNVDYKLCKLKYKEENREEKDKLPFHMTLCVWKEGNHKKIKSFINSIELKEIEMKVVGLKIKESSQNSYNLYFELEKNQDYIMIQEKIYNEFKIEKYNPKTFIPHITIHIDKEKRNILKIYNEIMEIFQPFTIKFSKLGIYEIYPPKKI